MGKVRIIPQTINPLTQVKIGTIKKKKVAAYARVSTDQEEQESSFDAQVQHFTEYIKSRDDWEFIKVYSDEGISGTSLKKRDGFNQMVADALNGKIDLILMKSISRFARNTLDLLTTVRKLTAKGVEVFFEEQNISTLDGGGELFLTIMSSIAQEESRTISENVKWGKKESYKKGNVSFAYSRFLGYKKEDGKIVIDKEQAVVVKQIYQWYLRDGLTLTAIAQRLNENSVKTPSGKNNWTVNNITSILTNEKYKGHAILQKTYCDNFLTHQMKKNTGQMPKYHVEDSHPAIIDEDTWNEVQLEIQRRREIGSCYSSTDVFSGKLICADCGSFYGAKVWHSTSKYARTVYQCNHKFKHKCQTPHLEVSFIKEKFIEAYNMVMIDKESLIEDTKEGITVLCDFVGLDGRLVELQNEMDIVSELSNKMIIENMHKLQSQEEYTKKYEELLKRYEKANVEYGRIQDEKLHKIGLSQKLESFIKDLENRPASIDYFDETTFRFMVESVKVDRDKRLTFKFRNGKEIEV